MLALLFLVLALSFGICAGGYFMENGKVDKEFLAMLLIAGISFILYCLQINS